MDDGPPDLKSYPEEQTDSTIASAENQHELFTGVSRILDTNKDA